MARVIVVGGGLAGLAATVSLAGRGHAVTLLEARPRLGGRASSFTDPASGEMIDACQHVSMGCCTAFHALCETVGVRGLLTAQPRLWFRTPDGRESVFAADPWPAPFHLGRALLGAHYLTPTEKLRIAYGVARLALMPPDADPPLEAWLLRHRQTRRTIDRFWSVVLVSALNETVANVGLKYARKVFVDGFLRTRDGHTVHVPTVPLGRLYGDELRNWMQRQGVVTRLNCGVREARPGGVTLRNGSVRAAGVSRDTEQDAADARGSVESLRAEVLSADAVILAVPFERVLDVLPEAIRTQPFFARIGHLSPSPITSVHLWLDREVLNHPHAVLVDSLGQWVFTRGEVAPGRFSLQVVVSASRELKALGREEIQSRIVEELKRLYPRMRDAKVLQAKVVTERTATYSVVPGVDEWRPTQRTPVPGLVLAGDYTRTGWPATMEGAVRSGQLAAEAVLKRN